MLSFFSISLLSFLTIAPCVYGQQASPPKVWRLTKVETPGLQRYSQEQVIAASGLQIGQQVDVAALNAAADRLRNSGLFVTVGYRYLYIADQLELTFHVEEAKWTVPVVFDNFIWFTDEEIHQAVRQQAPTFDGTAPKSGGVINTITKVLERLLQERKIQGQVEYVPEYEPSGEDKEHVFSIKGLNMPVCALRFPGAAGVKEGDLIRYSKPLMNAAYSRSFVTEFVKYNLLPVYRERSYLRADIRNPQVGLETGPGCKSGVTVTLAVEEGLAYSWGKAEWAGNAALSSQELESLLGMKAGEPANGLKIGDGLKSVQTAYGKRGFITAKLDVAPNFEDASRRVDYRVSINEGPQYRMGRLIFNGVPEKDADRLRKKWKLQQGEVYDTSYLEQFFKTARTDNKPDKSGTKTLGVGIKPDRQNLTVDVTIILK